MNAKITQTPMTKLRRARQRGAFERQTVYDILDASPLCHLGYQRDGRPVVMPTCHWRIDDRVYWHGSRASRTMLVGQAEEVCLTVTHLDGLVLARSGFHHSANYRCAMVFGQAEIVDDPEHKLFSLERFIDGLFPKRWATLRPPSRKEMNATTVLSLRIDEASAKVRSGPPNDLAEDLDWPVWAGVLPLQMQPLAPQPCQHNAADCATPGYVQTGLGAKQ